MRLALACWGILALACDCHGPNSRPSGADNDVTLDPAAPAPVTSRDFFGVHLGEPLAAVRQRYHVSQVRESGWSDPGCECWQIDSTPSGGVLGRVFAQVRNGYLIKVFRSELFRTKDEALREMELARAPFDALQEKREYDPPALLLTTPIDGQKVEVFLSVTHHSSGLYRLRKEYQLLPRESPDRDTKHPEPAAASI